ncbi:MAG: hypothetical protein J6S44_05815 [Clostridia bacterium]|nr:hypothetical protein [Clostridia bacterium]
MKTMTRILAFALLAVMVLSLVACSSYGAIVKNFKNAGYVEVNLNDADDSTAKKLTAEMEEGNLSCSIHLLQLKENDWLSYNAIILEFASDEALTEALDDNATLKGLITDAQKTKLVRGNCILIPLSLIKGDEMIKLFNEGK